MNINKQNYEAYFLDYFEGNLSPEQVAELLLFVEQHPELKNEFESFENISISDDSSAEFDAKDLLKKQVRITAENCEEYFIRAVEADLNGPEEQALQTFLEQHPQFLNDYKAFMACRLQPEEAIVFGSADELKRYAPDADDYLIASMEGLLSESESALLHVQAASDARMKHDLEAYAKTKLSADLAIVYPDKDELKRRNRVVPFYYYAAAVAAAILLILGLSVMFNTSAPTTAPEFAGNQNNKPAAKSEAAQEQQPVQINEEKLPVAVNNTKKNSAATENRKETNNVTPVQHPEPAPQLAAVDTAPSQSIVKDPTVEQHTNEPVLIAQSSEPAKSFVKPEYLSLGQIAAEKIKKKTLDNESLAAQKKTGRLRKMNGWDVLQIVAKGVSKATGADVAVNPTYNDEGEVTAYAVNAGRLGFSHEK